MRPQGDRGVEPLATEMGEQRPVAFGRIAGDDVGHGRAPAEGRLGAGRRDEGDGDPGVTLAQGPEGGGGREGPAELGELDDQQPHQPSPCDWLSHSRRNSSFER